MKKKDKFYAGLMLIVFGIGAIVFGILMQNKIPDRKIQFSYIFGAVFVVIGIKNIIDYKKENPHEK